MSILALTAITPFVFWLIALTLADGTLRRGLGPAACLSLLGWTICASESLSPELRLWIGSFWLLLMLKGWSLLLRPRAKVLAASPLGMLFFSYLWPGIDSRPFEVRKDLQDSESSAWFVTGFPTMACGLVALGWIAFRSDLPEGLRGLGAIFAVLVSVHFGFSDILSSFMRLAGFRVPRLFDAPLRSVSLNDFWTHRWNRPFVEMNRLLFRPLVKARLGKKGSVIALFVLSGLLHELALSFPPGAGFGGPLLYFALHGALMLAEGRISQANWPRPWRRVWTWSWILVPSPLLFHKPFQASLILPWVDAIKALPPFESSVVLLGWLLWLAGWGHFLVLVASFQVPYRLGWKQELQLLRPLNRKLMWVYGGYIASMIAILGIATLNLSPQMLSGEKGALCWAGLAALFWWSRVIVDAIVFEHSDWPQGVQFVLGHTLLTSLFVTLATVYSVLLLWHLV